MADILQVPGFRKLYKSLERPSNKFFHCFSTILIGDNAELWEGRGKFLSSCTLTRQQNYVGLKTRLAAIEAHWAAAQCASGNGKTRHYEDAIFETEMAVDFVKDGKAGVGLLSRKASLCFELARIHEAIGDSASAEDAFKKAAEAAVASLALLEHELSETHEPFLRGRLLERKLALHIIAARSIMTVGEFGTGVEHFAFAIRAADNAAKSYESMRSSNDLKNIMKQEMESKRQEMLAELEKMAEKLSENEETAHGAGLCFAMLADLNASDTELFIQHKRRSGAEFARFGASQKSPEFLIEASEQNEAAGMAQLQEARRKGYGGERRAMIQTGIEYLRMALENRKQAIALLDPLSLQLIGGAQQQKADELSNTILKTERDFFLEQAEHAGHAKKPEFLLLAADKMLLLGDTQQALVALESAAHAYWNEQAVPHAGEYQKAIDIYSQCLSISVDSLNRATKLQDRAFWQGKTVQYQMLVDGMEANKD